MTEKVISEIYGLLRKKQQALIAIDGRCASGKTTLAEKLAEKISCNVIHMDDFFLRPEQRTAERYEEPGGNVDRERFMKEVLLPLKTGEVFSYRPFSCYRMTFTEPVVIHPNAVTVIEGTYSCHPALWDSYDLHIFLTVSLEDQLRRLEERDRGNLQMFCEKWIPLEERYFSVCEVERRCEIKLHT